MKKFIAILLCMIMVLSIMIVPAMAGYTLDELFPQRVSPVSTNAQQNPQAVSRCLDNATATCYYMTYWTSKINDDVPELTFTFANATISELWIRNGNYVSQNQYKNNARPIEMEVVYVTPSGNKHYTYNMIDQYDFETVNSTWKCGYQKLAIPEVIYGVSEIRIYVPHIRVGSGDGKNNINIGDIVFVGSNDPNYIPPTPAPTPIPTVVPTPVPTVVPTSVPTPTPFVPVQSIDVDLYQPVAGYAGPGIFYEDMGQFLGANYRIKAVSRAWDDVFAKWWVQVEFQNTDGRMMRTYVDSSTLNVDLNRLAVETVQRMNVTLMNDCWAYRGPNPTIFARYDKMIPRNTVTNVFAEANGFALIEYYDMNTFKSMRLWVPSAALK